MDITRCLDSYALMEIMNGNPKFAHYLNLKFIIADMTLAEFYGVILREQGEEKADYWLDKFQAFSMNVSLNILTKAVKFRYVNRDKNISLIDAIGYIFSKENNYIFVTGDREFEKLENVEFIKK